MYSTYYSIYTTAFELKSNYSFGVTGVNIAVSLWDYGTL